MGTLIVTKSNDQLVAEEREAARKEDEAKKSLEGTRFQTNLASYIRTCWDKAVRAKEEFAAQMIASLRQRKGEYDPDKLAQIKQVGVGADVFMMITSTKCRAGEAWVRDIIFQPGQKPWDIEPTPVPDIPEEIREQIKETVIGEAARQMAMRLAMMGQPVDPRMIGMFLYDNREKLEESIRNAVFRDAKKKCDVMKKHIDDQFEEGGFYVAIDDCIFDIMTLKVGVIKGPIKRWEKIRKIEIKGGNIKPVYEEQSIPEYDRISPFDVFPAQNSTGVDDGYLIERIPLRRDQIAALLKLDKEAGFDETAIRNVLKEFGTGGLREWTSIDQEKETMENRSQDIHDSDKIDCLQFWGPVQGKKLKEFGGPFAKIEDEDIDYHVVVNLIGSHIIQAKMNDDPMGKKPYSITSFEKIPGSFWGNGVPETIGDCQQMCNAQARAILNNTAIGSGPMVERNIDRIPEGESKLLHPWKVWDVTEEMAMTGSAAPALKFYQPPIVVEKLISVYNTFSKIADEHSGIPAYAHGDPQVGGAGNTASGLSMLMGSAARGIKAVIKNIDRDIIKTVVTRQYFMNLEDRDYTAFVGDAKVVAAGTSALIAKEQQAVRLNEFARTTANPIDFQITGIEGRRYILKTVAKALDLDIEKVIPENGGQMGLPQLGPAGQPQIGNAPPMPGQQTLDAAGNPAQGTDFKLFPGGPTNA